jgi:hypothetical protein
MKARLEMPETLRLVSVPTLVMFGCEGPETERATFALIAFPERAPGFKFEIPEPLPDMKARLEMPETLRLVSVPTLVMFGWDG